MINGRWDTLEFAIIAELKNDNLKIFGKNLSGLWAESPILNFILPRRVVTTLSRFFPCRPKTKMKVT